MRHRRTLSAEQHARATHLAWLLAFVTTVALVTVLGVVRSAQALTVPTPGATGLAVSPPFEEEEEEEGEGAEASEGEEEASECEGFEGDEEAEEACEEEELEAEELEECGLSSADAIVSVSPRHDTVRLAIRYKAFAPTAVAIEYRLRGGKGSLKLGQSTKRFSRSGLFHDTEKLSEKGMTRVMAAREFIVTLRAVNSPHRCRGLFDQHLTIRHATPSGPVWSDQESSFRFSHRH